MADYDVVLEIHSAEVPDEVVKERVRAALAQSGIVADVKFAAKRIPFGS